MYVRKFQGESIEETIKEIKKELGPEAIILKTETFKGIKSALKKSKVEITAAITEKNLKKKMNVDKAIGGGNREKAYEAPADQLVGLINDYDKTNENLEKKAYGYGGISLNKNVQSKVEEGGRVVNELVDLSSLDNFLSEEKTNNGIEKNNIQEDKVVKLNNPNESNEETPVNRQMSNTESRHDPAPRDLVRLKEEILNEITTVRANEQFEGQINALKKEMESLQDNINLLKSSKQAKDEETESVLNILTRSGISEDYINNKLLLPFYRLKREKKDEINFVDFCVETCKATIEIHDYGRNSNFPKAYIYLSPPGTGQSTLIKKIIKKNNSGEIFTLVNSDEVSVPKTADKILNINNVTCSDPAKLFANVRRCLGRGVDAHVDLRITESNMNEIFQLINLFKGQGKMIKTMITLSSRFGHNYNRRIVERFSEISSVFNLTFFDQCYDVGSIFNLFNDNENLEIAHISSGEEIPNDLVYASDDLLIKKIFNV